MRVAFVQQHAVADKTDNITGVVVARAERLQDASLSADLDLRQVARSQADRLLMRHRRAELYARWFGPS